VRPRDGDVSRDRGLARSGQPVESERGTTRDRAFHSGNSSLLVGQDDISSL